MKIKSISKIISTPIKDITEEEYYQLFEKYIIYIKYPDANRWIDGEIQLPLNEYLMNDVGSLSSLNTGGTYQHRYFIKESETVYLLPLDYKNKFLERPSNNIFLVIVQEEIKRGKHIKLK